MVRFKNRYALCELVFPEQTESPPNVDNYQVYKAVKASLLESYGDFGLGALQSSLSVKYLNVSTNIAVIRGERRHFDMLVSSLAFIRKAGPFNVTFKTLHVGGSIRSCQKFLIHHHQKNLSQIFPKCKTPEERAQVMKSIMAACDSLELSYKQIQSQSSTLTTSSALDKIQKDDSEDETR